MTINTNLDALSSLTNLQSTSDALTKSIQRLSSGLRINTPADDPAGFLIANALQAQVDSLNQAIENTQGATNLVKTASSSLTQINSLLSSIRQNALDAANNVSLNPTAAQADQTAITNAIQAINSIAANTQYGSQKLLDGTAGISAAATNATTVAGITLGGSFGGGVTQAGNVTITVNNAATRATVTGTATYAGGASTLLSQVNGGTTGTGGTVVINGQSITVTGSDTVQTLLNRINNVQSTTGVGASFDTTTNKIVLTQNNYGGNFKISESESATLIAGTGGANATGLNATVTVTATVLSGGVATAVSTTFVGGRSASDTGLRVTDSNGNSLLLTEAGNTTATSGVGIGKVSVNPLQFQIGANVGQTASLAVNGVSASNLGTTSVPGLSLATIDVTTATGAANALQVIDEAASAIRQQQAQLGSFQTNVLQSTSNYLTSSVQNLTASISSIQDVNVAQEAVNFTNLQVLQQLGISALYTAKNSSAIYLKLLS